MPSNPTQPANLSLAIELTSRTGSIAIGCADEFFGSEIIPKRSRHHDDVMPAVDRLFSRFQFTPEQLAQIFVSIGPGGFTGLRQAVTTAKLLAFATGARILAIPTTTVVAETITITKEQGENTLNKRPLALIVALASKRGTSWCAQYTPQCEPASQAPYWKLTGEAHLTELAHLNTKCNRPLIIAADFIDESLKARLATDPEISIQSPAPTAEACCRAAQRLTRLANTNGESTDNHTDNDNHNTIDIDPFALVPLYGREPEAVRLWKSHASN